MNSVNTYCFKLLYDIYWTLFIALRRVWRYQRGNQNPYIEEEQTTQWPKERVQRNKQRSTKHTHKTKDGETRTPFKTGGELMCSGRVSSSCSTSDNRRVNLVTNGECRVWNRNCLPFCCLWVNPWFLCLFTLSFDCICLSFLVTCLSFYNDFRFKYVFASSVYASTSLAA